MSSPRFFGPGDRLYGVYHLPQSRVDRDAGVVFVNPFAPEAAQTHRALRQMAVRLSRAGFHVLRFDYSNTGDSSGETDRARLAQWQADVGTAAAELLDLSGVSKVFLVGLRLGAALAVGAANGRRDVAGLVLWEPVVDGEDYIEDVLTAHEAWSRERGVAPVPNPPGVVDVLGFPLTDALRRDLASIDLLATGPRLGLPVLVLANETATDADPLVEALRGRGAAVRSKAVPTHAFWSRLDENRVVVPTAALSAIAEWLERGGRE